MLNAGEKSVSVRGLRAVMLLIMRILFRIEHSGKEHVPEKGPVLIVSNHVTYFDPFWIGVACHRKVRYMAWDKIFSFAPAGLLLRWLGAFPVSLSRTESGPYRTSLRILNEGDALVIFPEGGRSVDGSLMRFKEGAATLAMKSGSPIIPVAITGGEKVWSPGMRFPHPGKVCVLFLPPIQPEAFLRTAEDLTIKIRSAIQDKLAAEGSRHSGMVPVE